LVDNNSKTIRLLELLLVLIVAVAPALLGSLVYFSKGLPLRSESEISLRLVLATVYELLSLGVLCYVLFRQGRSRRVQPSWLRRLILYPRSLFNNRFGK
jgi:hypothetical protein